MSAFNEFFQRNFSAVLAAGAPHIAPFMADECLLSMPEVDGLDYTMKEYMRYTEYVKTCVERLNSQSPGEVFYFLFLESKTKKQGEFVHHRSNRFAFIKIIEKSRSKPKRSLKKAKIQTEYF